MSLRDYQTAALRAISEYSGDKQPMIVLPTGTGKTRIGASYAASVVSRGGSVAWITHRDRLARDAHQALSRAVPGERVGYVGSGLGRDYDSRVVVLKKDTARRDRHLEQLSARRYDLVVVDEVHHHPAPSFRALTDGLVFDRMLGLTATPEREDGASLAEDWDVVFEYPLTQAIDDGWILRPYACVSKVPGLDLSKVKTGRRDYVGPELERELIKLHVAEYTVQQILQAHEFTSLPFGGSTKTFSLLTGGGVLVYCAGIEQAESTDELLRAAGVASRVIHSHLPQDEQNATLNAFEAGDLSVIVNVGILTEGTDLPRAQSIVIARATTSASLYQQMVGRALRLYSTQEEAYVLDLVGATRAHSLVSTATLLGGRDCRVAPDGKHRVLPGPAGTGFCTFCGERFPCSAHGVHKFRGGVCDCGADQCERSPPDEPGHHFVPWESGVQLCIFCGQQHPDPATSLVDRVDPPPIKVNWQRLKGPAWPKIYVAHLGEHGILFNVHARKGFKPLWHPRGGPLRALCADYVSAEMSRLVTNDVARKAKKVRGAHGGHKNAMTSRMAFREAARLARTLHLWELS